LRGDVSRRDFFQKRIGKDRLSGGQEHAKSGRVRGCLAVDFESEGGRRRLTVENSSLHDYDFLGILAFGPGTTLHVIGNVISGRGLKPSFFGQGAMQLVDTKGVIEENIITNSDNAGIFVAGSDNTIRDNTINEAAIGLLVSPGNKLSDNRFFNTPVIRELFVPGASLASSQRASSSGTNVPALFGRRRKSQ
jgi:parallel beta-helix repeat protein